MALILQLKRSRLVALAILMCVGLWLASISTATHLSLPTIRYGREPREQGIIRTVYTNRKLQSKEITYSLETTSYQQTVLVLSLIGSSDSFGTERSFKDYFQLLQNLSYPTAQLTLGLLVNRYEDLEIIDQFVDRYYHDNSTALNEKFSSVKLLTANFLEDDSMNERGTRQNPEYQSKRRSILAKARNYLVNSVLRNEDYCFWLDSDISKLPSDLIEQFVKTNKDIVTVRVTDRATKDYDLNSWVGERKKPTSEEYSQIKNKKQTPFNFVPQDIKKKMKHLSDFRSKSKTPMDLVKLDSVGSAVLFVKSEIHKLGVMFAPYYIIGISDWDFWEGYDGIESESICFQAEKLGYECYGLPDTIAFHKT